MNWEQLLSLKRYGDTEKDQERLKDETRLGFEVDFDRIIFSEAFRSLQDKTQVIPLSETDFVHTTNTQFRSLRRRENTRKKSRKSPARKIPQPKKARIHIQ